MATAQTPQNKTALRDQLLTARNRRPLADVVFDAAAIGDRLLASADGSPRWHGRGVRLDRHRTGHHGP